MTKYLLRIPCKESFAFIEEQYEGDDVKGRYDELFSLMNDKNDKENVPPIALYNYIVRLMDSDITKWEGVDFYQSLDSSQKEVLQAIKRFRKRLDNATKD